ncbi:MAG: penicillin-binding protein 1B [Gammaproteobacteria bacterium]|nr:penicillin-binding protein 1B [Gammaproteobacteria bacterium]
MGERTVQEVLKRRSDETIRKLEAMRNKGKPRKKRGSGWKGFILFLVVVLLLAGLGWAGWLGYSAKEAFAAHRWDQPARVYARALELYPDQQISRAAVIRELERLGYRQVEVPDREGSYSTFSNGLRLVTRGFVFWDGTQDSREVSLQFSGDRLASIKDTGRNDQVVLLRLDPPLIGNIFPASGEDRIVTSVDEVPQLLVDMLLAVEDRRYYEHAGVDPKSVLRAAAVNIEAGQIDQGGSTITQQLVKNFYLTPERSFVRKANEAVMAFAIEMFHSKKDILSAYLNEVYLGQDGQRAIHGFGLASHFWFQRPIQELEPHQMALLVGMIRGPAAYDPRRNAERARERRNQVLDIAVDQGVLEDAAARAAREKPLGVTQDAPAGTSYYPAFMDLVKEQLAALYNEGELTRAGLKIFSTLDPDIQLEAEQALDGQLTSIERSRGLPAGSLEGAVVVTGLDGAEVRAVVGGRDARFAGFNRALSAVRPIGSLMKPVVYLSAFNQPNRFSLATLVEDQPLEVELPDGKVWKPENYKGEYHGTVPIYSALVNSYNIPTVKVGLGVGVEEVIRNLQLLGFGRRPTAYPSLLLGAVTMTPMEVAQIYNTLAVGGFRTPLRAIREVIGPDGQPLTRYDLEVKESTDMAATYVVNRALQWVTREGTARSAAQLPFGVAGKTGTTNDYRDSWFAGYSGDQLSVVWVGRDDNEPSNLTGASGALPVWIRLMRNIAAESYRPVKPDNVEEVLVDMRSWQRASEGCNTARRLPFVEGSAPDNEPACGGNLVDKMKSVFQ